MSGHLAFASAETEDENMAHPCSTSSQTRRHRWHRRWSPWIAAVLCVALASTNARAAISASPVFTLPASCGELLSDIGPFLGFLEAVASGLANSERTLSKRVLRLLALRNEALRNNDRLRNDNPIDGVLRRALCFYREQREPIRPVPFDDEGFVRFLRESIGELEKNVENAIFEIELESARRRQLESRLAKNRAAAERLEAEANRAARTSYDKILERARKKAK
jgi:hypothetical protein